VTARAPPAWAPRQSRRYRDGANYCQVRGKQTSFRVSRSRVPFDMVACPFTLVVPARGPWARSGTTAGEVGTGIVAGQR